jgi:hypothetical protein
MVGILRASSPSPTTITVLKVITDVSEGLVAFRFMILIIPYHNNTYSHALMGYITCTAVSGVPTRKQEISFENSVAAELVNIVPGLV